MNLNKYIKIIFLFWIYFYFFPLNFSKTKQKGKKIDLGCIWFLESIKKNIKKNNFLKHLYIF